MAFRIFLRTIYSVGLSFVVVVTVIALPYYLLPVSERPRSALHNVMKPGGLWGHGLGIIGSAMILLLLLYSVRKRRAPGFRWGALSRWLDIHIFFGVMGPLLITLHTAMKFHGLVSISYFSMVAVVLSGVFGRYIYMQIPRDPRGHVRSLGEVQKRVHDIAEQIAEKYKAPEAAAMLADFSAAPKRHMSWFTAIFWSLSQDFISPFRTQSLKRRLEKRHAVPKGQVRNVVALMKEQRVLQRRIAFLDSMTEALHYWHVFHKPFAYVMLIIMFVHVGVTVTFGYRWIW